MTSGIDKRKALGKGLSALLPGRAPAPVGQNPVSSGVAVAPVPSATKAQPTHLPIELIEANPDQPRTNFRLDQLDELANSLKLNGIIQPILVRSHAGKYQIVAGERRWRAAKIANLAEVPVVVQDVADRQMLELALVENIQRE